MEADWMHIPLSVRTPARYLGREVNLPAKTVRPGILRVVLAFADVYEVGMSHIGLKILYHILNGQEEVLCERVFAPWTDMAHHLRRKGAPLVSLETQTPLNTFDMVGFSLQYEMSYPTLLAMLEMGGIPLKSEERGARHPFVLAGGPCAVNPEPLAPFIDAFVIGDGERAILEIAETLRRAKASGAPREKTLESLAEIAGVYVPAFFDARYDAAGRPTRIIPLKGRGPVRRRIEKGISGLPFPTREVVPIIRAVHDRYAVEIARGCLQGCRFCQAGFIYRPYRERDQAEVLHLLKGGLAETGYGECSFLSLSAGDYSRIPALLDRTVSRNLSDRTSISLPSLRVTSLTRDMIGQIQSIRKTGFTLAPEAGTQRLRDVINKKIDEGEIFRTVETIFSAGWHLVKLYFMIGLPTETQEDVEGIVVLATRIWRMARKISPKNEVTVSVSTFVPKPHTPFQWCQMTPLQEVQRKQEYLRSHLRRRGLRVKWHDARLSYWEGVLSRGGRPLSAFLEGVARAGAYLDGWTDQFRHDTWEAVAKGFEASVVTSGLEAWDRDAVLPWDMVETGVRKTYLWEEYQRALDAALSPPCPVREGCRRCGVCDPERGISVKLSEGEETISSSLVSSRMVPERVQEVGAVFQATYLKVGAARYLGHLDAARALIMAARRARLPLAFSKGFHPAPKVRFSDPIPLGMESLCESVAFTLTRMVDPGAIKKAMNAALPPGLRLRRARCAPLKKPEEFDNFKIYRCLCMLEASGEKDSAEVLGRIERIRKGEMNTIQVPAKKGPVTVTLSDCFRIETFKTGLPWSRFYARVGNLPRGVRLLPLLTILFAGVVSPESGLRVIKLRGVADFNTGNEPHE